MQYAGSRDRRQVLIRQYMDRRILKIIFFVAAILASGCHTQTEQDKIQKTVTNIQKAAEEKDAQKILKSLSKTYNDPQGFSYDTVKGLLAGYFFRHQKIHVYIINLDVSAEGAAGKAAFQAILSGSKTGSVADGVPEALGMYSFDVSLKKEDGDWKVTSARWNKIN
jgi:hypothetical protein